MAYLSLQEKLSNVSLLIEIAKADGVVNPAEISYIFWVAKEYGLSELELGRLIADTAPLSRPIALRDRVKQFHRCVTMMIIDDHIAEEEVERCEKIGLDLGLMAGDIALALQEVRSLEEIPEPDRFYQIFKA